MSQDRLRILQERLSRGSYTPVRVAGSAPSPSTTYERMHQIDAAASALNLDILANVASPTFLSSWAAWLTNWKAFYAKTIPGFWDTLLGRPLLNLWRADEIATSTNVYSAQLQTWRDDYTKQLNANGQLVPPPTGPGAPGPVMPPGGAAGWSVPIWAWVVGGTVMTAVGYSVYKTWGQVSRRATSDRVFLESTVRKQLGFSDAAAEGRDLPKPSCNCSPPA